MVSQKDNDMKIWIYDNVMLSFYNIDFEISLKKFRPVRCKENEKTWTEAWDSTPQESWYLNKYQSKYVEIYEEGKIYLGYKLRWKISLEYEEIEGEKLFWKI